mmetsp:Transcript_82074/g.129737  ORF Transcript_82074/g.129737 Transcript_82074/m.129737 type:complete len:179 (+) Transcript_82074:19-555(+)
MVWHTRLLCGSVLIAVQVHLLATEAVACDDGESLVLLQGKARTQSKSSKSTFATGVIDEDEGTLAITAMERARHHLGKVREMNRIHGATGVGILEEQHAHYLVADMKEPQVPQILRNWKKELVRLSHKPWVLALKEQVRQIGMSTAEQALKAKAEVQKLLDKSLQSLRTEFFNSSSVE